MVGRPHARGQGIQPDGQAASGPHAGGQKSVHMHRQVSAQVQPLGHPQFGVLTAKEHRGQAVVQGQVDMAVIPLDPHQKERLAGCASTGVFFPDDHLAQAAQAGLAHLDGRAPAASAAAAVQGLPGRADHHGLRHALATVWIETGPKPPRNRALIRSRNDCLITAVSVLLPGQPQQSKQQGLLGHPEGFAGTETQFVLRAQVVRQVQYGTLGSLGQRGEQQAQASRLVVAHRRTVVGAMAHTTAFLNRPGFLYAEARGVETGKTGTSTPPNVRRSSTGARLAP